MSYKSCYKYNEKNQKCEKTKKCIIGSIISIGAVTITFLLFFNTFHIVPKGPNPILIEEYCNDGSTKLFDYSAQLKGTIINVGDAGYITINGKIFQNGNEWNKTEKFYMKHNEKKKYHLIFDEVKLSGGEIRCKILLHRNH